MLTTLMLMGTFIRPTGTVTPGSWKAKGAPALHSCVCDPFPDYERTCIVARGAKPCEIVLTPSGEVTDTHGTIWVISKGNAPMMVEVYEDGALVSCATKESSESWSGLRIDLEGMSSFCLTVRLTSLDQMVTMIDGITEP